MLKENSILIYNCGGLVLPSSSALTSLAQNRSNGSSLPTCVQQILKPYFTNLDLSKITVYNYIPTIIQKTAKVTPAAVTVDEDIYFAKQGTGGYDPNTIDGIKLIAHELTHTQQYKNYKTVLGYGWDYWDAFDKNKEKGMSDSDAYQNISFEVDARNNADRIIQTVIQVYDNNQPCLNGQPNPLRPALPQGFSQEVFDCQKVLFALGYLSDSKYIDGFWGRITKTALEKFQARNGLSVDGIIGKNVKLKMQQPIGNLKRA